MKHPAFVWNCARQFIIKIIHLRQTLAMSASQASQRIGQVAGHLNYPKGMLAGQVAIITGSGQGIGAEAARLFANEGAKVVVSDIDGRMRKLKLY